MLFNTDSKCWLDSPDLYPGLYPASNQQIRGHLFPLLPAPRPLLFKIYLKDRFQFIDKCAISKRPSWRLCYRQLFVVSTFSGEDHKQIFTTWSNPKGNSDTERVMRTIKEDIVWPYDWDNPFDFEIALGKWINDYNTDFPHQSLNNLTPKQCFETYLNKELVLTKKPLD